MKPEEDDDLPDVPELRTPEYHLTDDQVEEMDIEYSTRHPADWVVSGPLGTIGQGPGRRFASWKEARSWARAKYGDRLLGRIKDAARFNGNRWAFLIKGDRGPICR